MRFDNRKPCSDCPYRKDAPKEFWSPLEFSSVLTQDRAPNGLGHMFGCHKFRALPDDERRVCIGWLLNQRARDLPSNLLRLKLMQSKEARRCLKEASSDTEMFESIEEMCLANGVEPT